MVQVQEHGRCVRDTNYDEVSFDVHFTPNVLGIGLGITIRLRAPAAHSRVLVRGK